MSERSTEVLSRTLVRVLCANRASGYFAVVVPGWHPDAMIPVPYSCVPENLLHRIQVGKRLHARVNVGAERAEDLRFSDWEGE